MRLKDVPVAPAYLVCFDHYDNGAMEVWPMLSFDLAQQAARSKQDRLDSLGIDDCSYKAFEKLPRRRIYKYHQE